MAEAITSILIATALFIALTTRWRRGVFRMMRDRTMINDNSPGAWTLTWSTLWLARFSEEWRSQYPTTWAFGEGTRDVWYYSPKRRS